MFFYCSGSGPCARERERLFMENICLYDKLLAYQKQKTSPFHMPGHMGQALFAPHLPWQLDITEIHGFDNLHAPQGILRDAQNRAAALWGSEHAYFITNGSTGGILAGIYAAINPGDAVLVAANCHKSVYHAIELLNLQPVFLNPPQVGHAGIAGSISPGTVADAIQAHPNIGLCVITSPTYEGIGSDVGAIAQVLHEKNIPLFVDEAHGAHWGLSKHFPQSAITQGADLVTHSLHKTLPSLTQTAVLHQSGGRVDPVHVQHALSMFGSSSPSYPMLASIDGCVNFLAQDGGQALDNWHVQIEDFYQNAHKISPFSLLTQGRDLTHIHSHDRGKLTIFTSETSFTGKALMETLRRDYNIELEMGGASYALAMTSLATRGEDFFHLAQALEKIGRKTVALGTPAFFPTWPAAYPPVMPPQEATRANSSPKAVRDALGHISAGYVWLFPPGVPLCLPGTKITKEIVDFLETCQEYALPISHTRPVEAGFIQVVDKC